MKKFIGHLADHGGFSGGVDEESKPTRPISSYEYGNYEKEHDYGPLIIDSVVQPPVVSKEKKGELGERIIETLSPFV